MYRRFRQVGVWGMKNALSLLVGILLVGLGTAILQPGPARADESVDKIKKVALSDVSLSQRLMALETLKQKGSEAAVDALADIAAKGDLKIAVAACAQLGRVKTSGSKVCRVGKRLPLGR